MTKIERRAFAVTRPPAETRAADGATGDKLAGYAIVFNADSHDLGGFVERVAPTALTRSLDAAAAGDLNLFAFWSHDSSQPLGSTRGGKLVLSQDDTGLAFELDTTRFNTMQLDAARDGDLQMSFGFIVRADSWVQREDGQYERTLIDVDLIEVSPVVSPAYPDTTAAMRSLDDWKGEQTRESIDTDALLTSDIKAAIYEANAGVLDTVRAAKTNIELPQENVALNIKRKLMKKALDRRIKAA